MVAAVKARTHMVVLLILVVAAAYAVMRFLTRKKK